MRSPSTVLHCHCDRVWNSEEVHFWGCLQGCSHRGLTLRGKTTLNLGITSKFAGGPVWEERGNQLRTSFPLSLVPDCGEVCAPVNWAGATKFPKESYSCWPRTNIPGWAQALHDPLASVFWVVELQVGPPSPAQTCLTKRNPREEWWQQWASHRSMSRPPQFKFMSSSVFHHRQ